MEFTQNRDISEKSTETVEDRRARRLANLKPFRKGTSGNPGGRPVQETAEVRALAQEATPIAFGKIVELMDSDDPRIALAAATSILDRALGKPGKADENDDDGPKVQINIIRHGERVPPCN